jgi:hypothetical protein
MVTNKMLHCHSFSTLLQNTLLERSKETEGMEVNGTKLLVCADDVISLSENTHIKKNTEGLLKGNKEFGLEENKEN